MLIEATQSPAKILIPRQLFLPPAPPLSGVAPVPKPAFPHNLTLNSRFLQKMAATVSVEELAKHNKVDDLWLAVHGRVFDVTKFAAEHPGGKKVLLNVAGTDATKQFDQFHKMETLYKYGENLFVGKLGGAGDAAPSRTVIGTGGTGTLSDPFGEGIPYGDPNWYQEWHSPYFTESHRKFRAAIRAYVDAEIMPYAHEWDEKREVPKELLEMAAKSGLLPAIVGITWPTEFVPDITPPGGIKAEEYDAFHALILNDEVARAGSGGIMWGICGGLAIGLPPIMKFGSKELHQRVVGPCLRGEKRICLAITEPSGGSDVANLKTEAKLSADGSHYIVNGSKKWITNGVFADFFTVAVRTGDKGYFGVSLLLLERGMPGITTTQMKCSGVWSSGTTYITFEDVKVPVSNLIGKENSGFRYIMANFNFERLSLAISANRFSRVCLEESIKYAHKRKTFGQRLIDHPVIRLKLGHMARQIEATQSYIELITYQLTKMDRRQQLDHLPGPTALLKTQATTTFEFCAREAAQIFGGLAYTRGGQGEKIERLYREVRVYAIGGGSEEIMYEFAMRDMMRKANL